MIRNKIIYVIMLASVFSVMVLYPAYYTELVFKILLILPIITGILLAVSAHSVRVECRCPVNVLEKEDKQGIPINIKLINTGWLPLGNVMIKLLYQNGYQSRQMKEKLTAGVVSGGRGKGVVKTTYYLHVQNVGIIYISLKNIYYFDLLKLWKTRIKTDFNTKVAVMPFIYEPEIEPGYINRNIDVETDRYSKEKPGNDPSEVFSVREYQHGDRIRNIHWKLSSKKDDMMVKEHSLPIIKEPFVLVDLKIKQPDPNEVSSFNYYELNDEKMGAAASISSFLLEYQYKHIMCWYEEVSDQLMQEEVNEMDDMYLAMQEVLEAPVSSQNVLDKMPGDDVGVLCSHLFYICSSCTVNQVKRLREICRNTVFTIIIVNKYLKEQDVDSLREECERTGNKFFYADTLFRGRVK